MKNFTFRSLLITALTLNSFFADAQVPILMGMTAGGGGNANGVIFTLTGDASVFLLRYSHTVAGGDQPLGAFVKASNGKYYATTYWDGANTQGSIFSFNPSGNVYTKLYDFTQANGGHPGANLVEYTGNGKLYGMTQAGGANGYGVIFSFDPVGNVYTNLHDFDMTNGGVSEHCTLVMAPNGKFYGLASSGGINSRGVIFSFDPASNTYAKVYDFSNAMGSYPLGGLMLATDGKLYGMTGNGGKNNAGTLFSFNPAGNIYDTLFHFSSSSGYHPHGTPFQAADGIIYGMTYDGGTKNMGVLFAYDPVNKTYSKLFDFDNTRGQRPESGLIQGSDGRLYGMTHYGGTSNSGVVFTYDLVNATYNVIINFNGANGGNPYGDLLQTGTTPAIRPVSGFSASDSTLCANECITFTDKSTNFPTNWLWTFQGATPASSTMKNPKNICYLNAGTYPVKLIAYNSGGIDSMTVNTLIKVSPAPDAPTITFANDTLFSNADTSYKAYQWYKDNVLLPGETNAYLKVTSNGNYNLRVTNGYGCFIAGGTVLTVGTAPEINGLPLSISGNPVHDKLIIVGNMSRKQDLTLRIYNTLGVIVLTSALTDESSSVDVSRLAKGIYFAEVAGTSSRWISRFVKE